MRTRYVFRGQRLDFVSTDNLRVTALRATDGYRFRWLTVVQFSQHFDPHTTFAEPNCYGRDHEFRAKAPRVDLASYSYESLLGFLLLFFRLRFISAHINSVHRRFKFKQL